MKPGQEKEPTDMELSCEPNRRHQESERATGDSIRVRSKEKDSVKSGEPGTTHAESWIKGEP